MHWIAPSEKDTATAALEKRLWDAASDARSSEQDIRRQLIESRAVDVMVAVGPNMFYTVTLCKAATLKEIEAQGWSLNPGRYVGVSAGEAVSDEDFKEQLETLNEELETLNAAARELEATIAQNVAEILQT